jgi:hypothetical protein
VNTCTDIFSFWYTVTASPVIPTTPTTAIFFNQSFMLFQVDTIYASHGTTTHTISVTGTLPNHQVTCCSTF